MIQCTSTGYGQVRHATPSSPIYPNLVSSVGNMSRWVGPSPIMRVEDSMRTACDEENALARPGQLDKLAAFMVRHIFMMLINSTGVKDRAFLLCFNGGTLKHSNVCISGPWTKRYFTKDVWQMCTYCTYYIQLLICFFL